MDRPTNNTLNYSYIIIDLKSFYASVECVERGLNPMTTNLVVADPERKSGTICLAITPAMKALGVKNRCRIYEIPERVKYIVAPPRMKLYIEYSAAIYEIYLKYFSSDDIHVYSIDEAFMDTTNYLKLYNKTPKQIGQMIMSDIYRTTGITASCGVGTNLYLAKIALDISAKHAPDHIGELTEQSFRDTLWNHLPLTDFWRIGKGTEKRLNDLGIRTMHDITEYNYDVLYNKFGIDAELLIDHAWGKETTTMNDIKNYHSKDHSLSKGQVLLRDYDYEEALLVVKEMADLLCLDMVDKKVVTESITMYIGYSHIHGIPGSSGTAKYITATSSPMQILPELERLYYKIVLPCYPIRQICLAANKITDSSFVQYDLFHYSQDLDKEKDLQEAVLQIKKQYGKNSILKGMNLLQAGTTIERNKQIGGHKSGTTL